LGNPGFLPDEYLTGLDVETTIILAEFGY